MTNLKIPSRRFLRLAAGVAALPAMSRIARAQAYPSRPVRLIVGFAAGGTTDILARLIGQWLSEHLGQPFVVENRPGAAGNIATAAVAKAAPDGYTLLQLTPVNAINASLYEKLNFNFPRDIAAVAGIMGVPSVVVVNPSFPVKTISDFIAYAKTNPGKINMGSGGNGTTAHVFGELFKMMTGVNIVQVPYRGVAPALTDLLGGQVQVVFATMPAAVEYIRAGNLRALAVTSGTRWEGMPDIPTVSNSVPGYEASGWNGIGAPKNTPAGVIDRLNKEINSALSDQTVKARLADLGGAVLPGSPGDFGKLIADETEKWGKVIRAANIKPE